MTISLMEQAAKLCGLLQLPETGPEDVEFWQKIIDERNNDFPKLVYADWLEENGWWHGEYIRLYLERQILLNRMLSIRDRMNVLNPVEYILEELDENLHYVVDFHIFDYGHVYLSPEAMEDIKNWD